MFLKTKIKNIFKELQGIDNCNQDEYVELFLNKLLQYNLILEECVEKKQEIEDIDSVIEYDFLDKEVIFKKLSDLLQICNRGEKVGVFEDIYMLLKSLMVVLGDTASPKVKNRDPGLFDLNLAHNEEELRKLRRKWEEIVAKQKHLVIQKRIVSIIVRLTHIVKFHDEIAVQRLAAILLEIPESIADDDVLQELETICSIGEGLQQAKVGLGRESFIDVIEELQTTLSVSSNEIKQLSRIRDQIAGQSEDLIGRQDGEELLKVTNKFYEKIASLNQLIYKKEMHIKDLNAQLRKVTILLQQLEEKTKVDSLTGVYNRCHLEEILTYYEMQFMNNKTNYAVLFFDIDGFKDINDRHGHLAGDELLNIFAGVLRNNSRSSDIVGRYGGDEFLILMPKADVKVAKDVAMRICKAVAAENFVYHKEMMKVSTSIGVVDRKGFKTKEEMLRYADQLLYKAKKNGRNQVQWE